MNRLLATTVALGCLFGVAHAQQYPTKSIRFIVPFTPGGGTDTFARIVSPRMGDAMGQQIIVDNRPGAQGSIGTALGARAAPDGYTMTLGFIGTLTINPHLQSDAGFEPLKDFTGVGRGTAQPYVLIVHPTVPAKSVKELIALAHRQPGALTYGSSSSAAQLAGELFKLETKSKILHIPYKGAGPAMADLLGGHIGMMFSVPAAPVGHVQTGKLRALAITGPQRIPAYPDTPTMAEVGFPDLEITGWYGIVVPSGTSRDIVARLNKELVRALQMPDVIKSLNAAGLDPAPSSAEEFTSFIRDEYTRWGKVVKAAGIKVD